MKRFFLSLYFLLCCSCLLKGAVSPLQYGLLETKTGEERFWVLYNTHIDAIRQNKKVDYSKISSIDIEIPANAKSIPLTDLTDFKGVELRVTNTKKNEFTLFVLTKDTEKIIIDKKSFASYSFEANPELKKGLYLLIIEDENPWIVNRIGFSYGATRRDILLIKNGRALNKTISPYYNLLSKPRCSFVKATPRKKYFRNLTFVRTEASSMMTFLLRVKNVNNYEISGINLITSEKEGWYADAIISIECCTNFSMSNVNVNNTYSLENRFGYAFVMNNVWNSLIKNIHSKAKWGVFSGSNINKASLTDCNINRFDLHCYGRDYSLKRCTITYEMPISSIFGYMSFKDCIFENAYPCEYRYDYNAYTPFDLSFKDCVFKMDPRHNFIVFLSILSNDRNSRKELESKCLPNILIKNCLIEVDESVKSWDFIHIGDNYYTEPIGYISKIIIDGVKIKGSSGDVRLVTHNIETLNPVSISISNVIYNGVQIPHFYININQLSKEKQIVNSKNVRLIFE